MRITEKKVDLDYNDTKAFFKNRSQKFNVDNPYSVTMYQDNDPKLVQERNEREIKKLYPYLKISSESCVLDVACGIGRWADALPDDIECYLGIDFSEELINIANKRNGKRERFVFCEGEANRLGEVIPDLRAKYNTILVIGIMIYLNDDDLQTMLTEIEKKCTDHAVICIREPIGLQSRLTLKEFFSGELKDNYNAIYRTRDEIISCFENSLFCKEFKIEKEGFLFEDSEMNNRKETSQYFFILKR